MDESGALIRNKYDVKKEEVSSPEHHDENMSNSEFMAFSYASFLPKNSERQKISEMTLEPSCKRRLIDNACNSSKTNDELVFDLLDKAYAQASKGPMNCEPTKSGDVNKESQSQSIKKPPETSSSAPKDPRIGNSSKNPPSHQNLNRHTETKSSRPATRPFRPTSNNLPSIPPLLSDNQTVNLNTPHSSAPTTSTVSQPIPSLVTSRNRPSQTLSSHSDKQPALSSDVFHTDSSVQSLPSVLVPLGNPSTSAAPKSSNIQPTKSSSSVPANVASPHNQSHKNSTHRISSKNDTEKSSSTVSKSKKSVTNANSTAVSENSSNSTNRNRKPSRDDNSNKRIQSSSSATNKSTTSNNSLNKKNADSSKVRDPRSSSSTSSRKENISELSGPKPHTNSNVHNTSNQTNSSSLASNSSTKKTSSQTQQKDKRHTVKKQANTPDIVQSNQTVSHKFISSDNRSIKSRHSQSPIPKSPQFPARSPCESYATAQNSPRMPKTSASHSSSSFTTSLPPPSSLLLTNSSDLLCMIPNYMISPAAHASPSQTLSSPTANVKNCSHENFPVKSNNLDSSFLMSGEVQSKSSSTDKLTKLSHQYSPHETHSTDSAQIKTSTKNIQELLRIQASIQKYVDVLKFRGAAPALCGAVIPSTVSVSTSSPSRPTAKVIDSTTAEPRISSPQTVSSSVSPTIHTAPKPDKNDNASCWPTVGSTVVSPSSCSVDEKVSESAYGESASQPLTEKECKLVDRYAFYIFQGKGAIIIREGVQLTRLITCIVSKVRTLLMNAYERDEILSATMFIQMDRRMMTILSVAAKQTHPAWSDWLHCSRTYLYLMSTKIGATVEKRQTDVALASELLEPENCEDEIPSNVPAFFGQTRQDLLKSSQTQTVIRKARRNRKFFNKMRRIFNSDSKDGIRIGKSHPKLRTIGRHVDTYLRVRKRALKPRKSFHINYQCGGSDEKIDESNTRCNCNDAAAVEDEESAFVPEDYFLFDEDEMMENDTEHYIVIDESGITENSYPPYRFYQSENEPPAYTNNSQRSTGSATPQPIFYRQTNKLHATPAVNAIPNNQARPKLPPLIKYSPNDH